MITLGILQLNTDQEKGYLDEVAKTCKKKGIKVYRFTPFDVNLGNGSINGLLFNENEKWTAAIFPLPKYIYDRCFYPDDLILRNQIIKKVNILKVETMFVGHGLPNKWAVHRWLSESIEILNYLPPTQRLSMDTFTSYLNTFKDVIIKPIYGSGGKGLYFIKNIKGGWQILNGDGAEKYKFTNSLKDGYSFVQKIIHTKPYLIQRYLPIQINDRPFDLRVVMQKTSLDKWRIVGNGFRMGKEGSFISNLQAGGEIFSNLPFRKNVVKRLNRNLVALIPLIPLQIEKYHQPLFEIGIDFGISQQGDIWILEVNSKPGYQTIIKTTAKDRRYYIFNGLQTLVSELESKNLFKKKSACSCDNNSSEEVALKE